MSIGTSRIYLIGIAVIVILWIWAPWSKNPISEVQVINRSDSQEEESFAEESEDLNSDSISIAEELPIEIQQTEPSAEVGLTVEEVWKSIKDCLEFGVEINSPSGDIDQWVRSLSDIGLGEVVLQTEDWRELELLTPENERRRLYISIDYSSDQQVVRRLSYEKILTSGAREPLPMDPLLAIDPSETTIASIESDGKHIKKARNHRVYFENGEEVVLLEVNKKVVQLEINRAGRQVNCQDLDGAAKCECHRPPEDQPNFQYDESDFY